MYIYISLTSNKFVGIVYFFRFAHTYKHVAVSRLTEEPLGFRRTAKSSRKYGMYRFEY